MNSRPLKLIQPNITSLRFLIPTLLAPLVLNFFLSPDALAANTAGRVGGFIKHRAEQSQPNSAPAAVKPSPTRSPRVINRPPARVTPSPTQSQHPKKQAREKMQAYPTPEPTSAPSTTPKATLAPRPAPAPTPNWKPMPRPTRSTRITPVIPAPTNETRRQREGSATKSTTIIKEIIIINQPTPPKPISDKSYTGANTNQNDGKRVYVTQTLPNTTPQNEDSFLENAFETLIAVSVLTLMGFAGLNIYTYIKNNR